MASLVARYLPAVEILLGGAIVANVAGPYVHLFAALLILAFTFVHIRILYSNADVECGCYGKFADDRLVSRWTIRRNALLGTVLLLSIVGSDVFDDGGWMHRPLASVIALISLGYFAAVVLGETSVRSLDPKVRGLGG